MKLLRDIPTRHFVGIDIETVRIVENYDDLTPEWKSAWEYKNKQAGEVPHFEELSGSWEKNSALYAEFSKVCAISIVFLSKNGNPMVKEFYGDDELSILTGLADYLQRMSDSTEGKNFRLLGHAAKYFDYPFLCKRYIINGLAIPTMLDTAHLKPWESRNLCTNQDIWKMGGSGPGSSLQALCTALNIPISKVDLVGDEVGKAFYRKEYGRIARYCSLDTIATYNVVRRIKGETIFQFDEVTYVEDANPVTDKSAPAPLIENKEEETFTKASLVERINNSEQISDKEKKELTDKLSKNKIAKKDLPIIREIVYQLYANKQMFTGDTADVLRRKSEEIDNIMVSFGLAKPEPVVPAPKKETKKKEVLVVPIVAVDEVPEEKVVTEKDEDEESLIARRREFLKFVVDGREAEVIKLPEYHEFITFLSLETKDFIKRFTHDLSIEDKNKLKKNRN